MKYCSHFYMLILFFYFFSLPSSFSQSKGQWVQCTGEAAVQNISNEEAQVIAKRQARLNAIEKVCGVQIQAETLVKDFMLAGDFIHSLAYGHIVEEKDLVWKTETITPVNPSDPPIIVLKLSMLAKVVPVNEKPDPTFKVKLKLNRNSFESGDDVIFNIKSTKDCYLTIINLAANDSVYVLFPNKYHSNNYIEAKKTFIFPGKIDRESGFHIRVSNLPGHKKDTEIVKLIATKNRVDFLSDLKMLNGFGIMGTPKMAVTRLARLLSEIPISERAEATVMYTVSKRDTGNN